MFRRDVIRRKLFVIPILLVVSLVVYEYFESIQPGTLNIVAYSEDKYTLRGVQRPVLVSVSVQNSAGTTNSRTPTSLSLTQGTYTLAFGDLSWYLTPTSRSVSVVHGKSTNVTGLYEVVARVIAVSSSGFNTSQVTGFHGVTPIIWTNLTTQTVTFMKRVPGGSVVLDPGQNYTIIYAEPGSYEFTTLSRNATATVLIQ
jgi:hypothetical protein